MRGGFPYLALHSCSSVLPGCSTLAMNSASLINSSAKWLDPSGFRFLIGCSFICDDGGALNISFKTLLVVNLGGPCLGVAPGCPHCLGGGDGVLPVFALVILVEIVGGLIGPVFGVSFLWTEVLLTGFGGGGDGVDRFGVE